MNVGDLVKMKRDYCSQQSGLFVEFVMTNDWVRTGKYLWVRVLWPEGLSMERLESLEVINESR